MSDILEVTKEIQIDDTNKTDKNVYYLGSFIQLWLSSGYKVTKKRENILIQENLSQGTNSKTIVNLDKACELGRKIYSANEYDSNQHLLIFLHNCFMESWKIKLIDEKYILTKRHNNERKILEKDYLEAFLTRNFGILPTE